MIPKVLGVYETTMSEKVGAGTTSQTRSTRIFWFAAQVPGGEIACQPLTDAFFPSGIVQRVKLEVFLAEYHLVPHVFEEHLRSVVNSLRDRLHGVEMPDAVPELTHEEGLLFKGLGAFLHSRRGSPLTENDLFALRTMLDSMRQTGDVVLEYQRVVTGAAIDLRKQGRFDLAVEYYIRALELDERNDHIMFNLARVYFEMNRLNAARDMLIRAIEINPELEMARRFLRYLDAGGNS